jgi:predicted  nucleic acid-binding Zn ribbon protein
MFVVEGIFNPAVSLEPEQVQEVIDLLLGALRMNGQILGREYPIVSVGEGYQTFLFVPEENSLNKYIANTYVLKWLNKMDELGIEYTWRMLGPESCSDHICKCEKPKSYILYTTYVSLESPIRCGECFGSIPLYRLPATRDDEYVDIITWQSDYKACDTLQMNCSTGERFGLSQLSKHDSSLTKRGREICNRITIATGIPTYYYLLKSNGKGLKTEQARKCPSCNGEWLLQPPLHGLFNFQCATCRLLSNIAWSVQSIK